MEILARQTIANAVRFGFTDRLNWFTDLENKFHVFMNSTRASPMGIGSITELHSAIFGRPLSTSDFNDYMIMSKELMIHNAG